MNLTPEEERRVLQFKERQAALPRPTFAEEVKTLIDRSIGFGVLSTNSLQYPGFPTGSVVGFQTDQAGLPFFSFSTMSAHTNDLLKDGRASLTVMARNFQGAAEGRVVLIGKIKKVSDKEQREDLRARYLARHKDAYWIDFGYVDRHATF
jgi:putative heme iron utilization protein